MWTLLWFLAACGDGGRGDEPLEAALSITDPDGTPTTALTLATTPVGTQRIGRVVVTNTGEAPSGALALTLDGARDFTLEADLTTCTGRALDGGESCDVFVRYAPVTVGDHAGRLVIASSPGGIHELALGGSALLPELHFSPTAVSFGQLETGVATEQTIELVNDGPVELVLGPVAASGDAAFAITSTTCGLTLAAGARCDVVIEATPGALGALAGQVSVTSGGTEYAAPLDARGARRVTIAKTGAGDGSVTSTPAGLDCGATCTALFEEAVTLSAAPGAAARIASWSIAGCGTSTTCLVAAGVAPVTVTVGFELLNTVPVSITFAGNALGEVKVVDDGMGTELGVCTASCTVAAPTGALVAITAATPSVYGGMTGACTTSSGECLVTVPQAGLALTVTFTKSPGEVWTRILPGPRFHSAAFDGSGNLIVGSATRLTKLAPDGSTVFSLGQVVQTLDTGPGDTIYVDTGTAIRKLAPDGSELWTRAHTLGKCTAFPSFANDVSVGTDGAVVVRGSAGVERWDTDGTSTWAVPLVGTGRCGVAIDEATGVVYVLVEGIFDPEPSDLLQLAAADGAELERLFDVTSQYQARVAPMPGGGQLTCSSGHGNVYLSSPVGNGFEDLVNVGADTNNGCIAAGASVGWVHSLSDLTLDPDDWRLHRVGANASTSTRRTVETSLERWGTSPRAIAGSATGRLGLAGAFYGPASGLAGWVQVFDP